jgi:hypothetical protein
MSAAFTGYAYRWRLGIRIGSGSSIVQQILEAPLFHGEPYQGNQIMSLYHTILQSIMMHDKS